MKKIVIIIFGIILSCSKDEPIQEYTVIGNWLIVEITSGNQIIGLDDCSKNENYLFLEDNTFSWNVYAWESLEKNKCRVIDGGGVSGTWRLINNQTVSLVDTKNDISYNMTFDDEFLYFESPPNEQDNNSVIRFVFKRL